MNNNESIQEDQEESLSSSQELPIDNFSRVPDFILRFSTEWRKELYAVGILSLLLIATRWQAIFFLNSKVVGGFLGDGGLYLWLSKINPGDLFSNGWFNTDAFYPYTRTLAWSDNFLLPSLFTSLLSLIGIPELASYNLVLLLAMLLNGFLTYRLGLSLSGKWLPALISGAAFMVAAPITAQIGHPQLVFFFFIPLGLYILFAFAAKPGFGWGLLFGLTVFLSFLTTVYYSIFLVIIAGWFWFSLWLLRPYQFYLKTYLLFLLSSLVGFLPVLPFLIPYLEVSSVFGERGIYEAYAFASSGWSYLNAPPHTLLYPFLQGISHGEAVLFPGFAVLSLVGLCFFRAWGTKTFRGLKTPFILCFFLALVFADRDLLKPYLEDQRFASTLANSLCTIFSWLSLVLLGFLLRSLQKTEAKLGFHILTNRSLIALILSITILFVIISFGPLGNPERGQYALGPFRVLYELMPGADALRAISRAGLVSVFLGCLLLSFGLPLFQRRFKRETLAIAVVAVLIFVENYVTHFSIQDLPDRPHVYNVLEAHLREDPGVTVILPFTSELNADGSIKSWSDFASNNVSYKNWSSGTIVNGYSGQRTQIMRELPRETSNFPDLKSATALGEIANVRYVIVHTRSYKNFDEQEYLARQDLFLHRFEKLFQDESGDILYRYHPPQTRVTKEFNLRIPSFPAGGFLQMELMALYQPESPAYWLDIKEVDQLDSKVLARIELEANGEWQNIAIPLPSAPQKARPFRIELDPEPGADIFLRERRHFVEPQ